MEQVSTSTDNKVPVEPSTMPGNTTFVAGFTQSNVGDTSQNTLGAFCESPGEDYDGLPCDADHSTCGGTVQDCHGRGPGFRISDFESNRIIGGKQFEGALAVMNGVRNPGIGTLRVLVFARLTTRPQNNKFLYSTQRHCRLYLSYSHGSVPWLCSMNVPHPNEDIVCFSQDTLLPTSEGPGAFDFVQGDNSSKSQNAFWELVKGAVTPLPSEDQVACQYPKLICPT
ncbi:hypothetical protein E4T56_gene11084 [Termitomyces sp. T112]|nr:hypothetical protein E4T56_gene11084 [Termitomyces sp. T112]